VGVGLGVEVAVGVSVSVAVGVEVKVGVSVGSGDEGRVLSGATVDVAFFLAHCLVCFPFCFLHGLRAGFFAMEIDLNCRASERANAGPIASAGTITRMRTTSVRRIGRTPYFPRLTCYLT
jgi:hypothetical protein